MFCPQEMLVRVKYVCCPWMLQAEHSVLAFCDDPHPATGTLQHGGIRCSHTICVANTKRLRNITYMMFCNPVYL